MKLIATIPPRTDGTVIVRFPEGALRFADDGSGSLVCDVPEARVAQLLDTGNFEPADEADFDLASALMEEAAAGSGDSHPDESDLDDAPLEDLNGGQPLEGGAQPKPRRGRPPKAR